MMMAKTTAKAKSAITPQKVTAVAVAATADRSNTRAVASFTSPSPSRMVTSRGGRPNFLPRAVAATASVGLITAPMAIPAGSDRSGNITYSTNPVTNAVTNTSTTLSAEILLKLRRKSTTGTWMAAE